MQLAQTIGLVGSFPVMHSHLRACHIHRPAATHVLFEVLFVTRIFGPDYLHTLTTGSVLNCGDCLRYKESLQNRRLCLSAFFFRKRGLLIVEQKRA